MLSNKIVIFDSGHLSQTVVYRSLSYLCFQQTSGKPCGALDISINCEKCLSIKYCL